MMNELQQLKDFDPQALNRLFISSRAHVLLDTHQQIDGLMEGEKKGKKIGTTKRGIGPCYASKANRNGLRFADLLNTETLPGKVWRSGIVVALCDAQMRAMHGASTRTPPHRDCRPSPS